MAARMGVLPPSVHHDVGLRTVVRAVQQWRRPNGENTPYPRLGLGSGPPTYVPIISAYDAAQPRPNPEAALMAAARDVEHRVALERGARRPQTSTLMTSFLSSVAGYRSPSTWFASSPQQMHVLKALNPAETPRQVPRFH